MRLNKKTIMNNSLIKDNLLKSSFSIDTQKQPVIFLFDLEKDKVSNIYEYESLVLSYENIILLLFQKKNTQKLFKEVAKKLTDTSYSQASYLADFSDYNELSTDLNYEQITFYPEDFIIMLNSSLVFPKMKIYCQLNRDMKLVELTIE